MMQPLLALSCTALLSLWTMAFAHGWGPPLPNARSSTVGGSGSRRCRHMMSSSSVVNGKTDHDEQLKTIDVLSLDSIRNSLIRQEETIIFALIERAQYRKNSIVYQPGGFGDLGVPVGSATPPVEKNDNQQQEQQPLLSFMEYFFVGTEVLHCQVRRYTSPEEHAFFPERLPRGPLDNLPSLQYSDELLSSVGGASDVNFNKVLMEQYIDRIIPSIAASGDDEQHGSTVLADIAALQALSRRVHFGKFVAESKYRSDPEGYQKLVDAGDAEGVMELLTNAVVEAKVLRRARGKAATYGTEPIDLPTVSEQRHMVAEGDDDTNSKAVSNVPNAERDLATMVASAAASAVMATMEAVGGGDVARRKGKVDPSVIESVYRDIIIPMTKDIEVAYLFLRCGRDPPPAHKPPSMIKS